MPQAASTVFAASHWSRPLNQGRGRRCGKLQYRRALISRRSSNASLASHVVHFDTQLVQGIAGRCDFQLQLVIVRKAVYVHATSQPVQVAKHRSELRMQLARLRRRDLVVVHARQ